MQEIRTPLVTPTKKRVYLSLCSKFPTLETLGLRDFFPRLWCGTQNFLSSAHADRICALLSHAVMLVGFIQEKEGSVLFLKI